MEENKKTDGVVLSFVIPVYNVEEYLSECLDSCLKQDLENYEIVCVDDGSTDGSGKLLDEYAEKYSRIRVFHTENSGVSSARNFGVSQSQGKWIWFVDSDDFVTENCCGAIYEEAEKSGTEIVVFDFERVHQYEKRAFESGKGKITQFDTRSGVFAATPSKNYGNGPFMYWFLREKIQSLGLKFDKTMKYAEDTKFVFEYKFNTCAAMVFDYPMYFYRQRPGSAMNSLNAEAHAYCMGRLADLYNEYALKCDDDEEQRQKLIVARSRATRNALFTYCMQIRDYKRAKAELARFKELGYYPYKVKMGIYSKSFKGILINLFNEMLSHKWFYLLVCRIKNKKKKSDKGVEKKDNEHKN